MPDDLDLSNLLRLDRIGFFPGPLRRDIITFFGAISGRIICFLIVFVEFGDRRCAMISSTFSVEDHEMIGVEWMTIDPSRTMLHVELLLSSSQSQIEYGLQELKFIGEQNTLQLKKSVDVYGLEFFDLYRNAVDHPM